MPFGDKLSGNLYKLLNDDNKSRLRFFFTDDKAVKLYNGHNYFIHLCN